MKIFWCCSVEASDKLSTYKERNATQIAVDTKINNLTKKGFEKSMIPF
jgi:hypothetical protein